eukprot:1728724-Pleurochrysis_carterae.AAC.1
MKINDLETTPPRRAQRVHDENRSCKPPTASSTVTNICRSALLNFKLGCPNTGHAADQMSYSTSLWSALPKRRGSVSDTGQQCSESVLPVRRNSPEIGKKEPANFQDVLLRAATSCLDTAGEERVQSCLPVRQSWQKAGECVLCGDPVNFLDCDITSAASEHCADCKWLVKMYMARKCTYP